MTLRWTYDKSVKWEWRCLKRRRAIFYTNGSLCEILEIYLNCSPSVKDISRTLPFVLADRLCLPRTSVNSRRTYKSILYLSIISYFRIMNHGMKNRNQFSLDMKNKEKKDRVASPTFSFTLLYAWCTRYKIRKRANRSLDLSPPAAAKVIRDDLLRSHGRSPISSSYFSRLVINAVCFEPIKPAICS